MQEVTLDSLLEDYEFGGQGSGSRRLGEFQDELSDQAQPFQECGLEPETSPAP
jgi:hypothetical protein